MVDAVYAFGYADKGTYEPIPLSGHWWGDDFMPTTTRFDMECVARSEASRRGMRKYYERNRR